MEQTKSFRKGVVVTDGECKKRNIRSMESVVTIFERENEREQISRSNQKIIIKLLHINHFIALTTCCLAWKKSIMIIFCEFIDEIKL